MNWYLRAVRPRAASIFAFISLLIGTCQQPLFAESSNSAQGNSDSSEAIKIGFLSSFHGAADDDNRDFLNGMELFLDEVHHTVAGRKIQLVVENDESQPAKAIAKFKKLVEQDKVAVVAGIYYSPIGYALGPIADQCKTPLVVGLCGAEQLTQHNQHDWVVKICSSSGQRGHALGDYAYTHLGYRKIVTIGPAYAFGYEVVGGFQQAFESAGGQVVQKMWVGMDTKDFRPFLQTIRKDADAVFVHVVGEAASAITRQYKQVGVTVPLLGSMSTFDESVLPSAADVVGCISASPYCSTTQNAANKKFVAEYTAKYKKTPDWCGDAGYTMGMWIYRALQATKGAQSDRSQLLSALKDVVLADSPAGPLRIDHQNGLICNMYIRKFVKDASGYHNEVVFTYPGTSQFWKWLPEEFLKQPPYSREFPPCKYCQ
jgi:branched-chain amino acid transport system substrate-binding protein